MRNRSPSTYAAPRSQDRGDAGPTNLSLVQSQIRSLRLEHDVVDGLASWNDGAAKDAISGFITAAATPGDGFIEPADRIAVFDNDGTMWIEQPLPGSDRLHLPCPRPRRPGGPAALCPGPVQVDPRPRHRVLRSGQSAAARRSSGYTTYATPTAASSSSTACTPRSCPNGSATPGSRSPSRPTSTCSPAWAKSCPRLRSPHRPRHRKPVTSPGETVMPARSMPTDGAQGGSGNTDWTTPMPSDLVFVVSCCWVRL